MKKFKEFFKKYACNASAILECQEEQQQEQITTG